MAGLARFPIPGQPPCWAIGPSPLPPPTLPGWKGRKINGWEAVAQARGVLALAAAKHKVLIAEFSPLEVKSAVVGYGKAPKKQVQDMIKILLNLDAPPKPDDAADALGLAICQIHAGTFQSAVDRS